MKYEQAYRSEGYGAFELGIDIRVAAPAGVTDEVSRAAYKAADILEQAITRDFFANNKDAQERAESERRQLLACFGAVPIFTESIPNGYCDRSCCEHLPWFKVATPVGYIRVGWRKRVIVIDWSDAPLVSAKAEELFPDEDVTKEGRLIHAWSYEKAREYLDLIFKAGTVKIGVAEVK